MSSSSNIRSSVAVAFATIALTSCGLFGPKSDPDPRLDFPQSYGGCFNKAGARVEGYLNGDADPKEWGSAWDCTMESLRMLNKYSAESTGYNNADLESLITTLVLTDTELPKGFVPAAIELKASLIGGARDRVTPAELEHIIKVFSVLKEESVAFIPQLVIKRDKPNPANMIAFGRALTKAITKIGGEFSPKDAAPLTRETITTLINDLDTILKVKTPSYLVSAIMASKVLLTGGSPDQVESNTWNRVFGTLGAVGGPLLAMMSVNKDLATGPNEYGEFLGSLGSNIESALEGSVTEHNGLIPAVDVDRVLDSLPDDMIKGVTRPTMKKLTRAATGNVLGAAEAGGLDQTSLRRALGYFNDWKRGKTQLETLYAKSHISRSGVSKADFLAAASSYAASLGAADRPDVMRLMSIADEYRPMYLDQDEEISLTSEWRYSLNQMDHLNWMNLAAEVAIRSYSTEPDRSSLSLDDFRRLYLDAEDFGLELKVIDPNVPDFDGRRFREADYYMPTSNGDGKVDASEATYYIAYLSSISALGKRIRADIEEPCKNSDELGPMDYKWMGADCVRQKFFSNLASYWNHAPLMLNYYNGLSLVMKSAVKHDIEAVARLRGFTQDPYGGYDLRTLAASLHYVETLYNRFDQDGSQIMNTQETIDSSALFAPVIAAAAGLDVSETDKIQGVYTFIMKNGRKPADGLGGTIEVGAWMLVRPFWDLRIDRAGVYKAFTNFVTPVP